MLHTEASLTVDCVFENQLWNEVESVPAYIDRDLRWYLECGVLVQEFARPRCEQCAQEFLIAYSCKVRGG